MAYIISRTATDSSGTTLKPSSNRVLVIGAGCAGLQTARALKNAGFKITVLEVQGDVGGCWISCHPGAQAYEPAEQYAFPEFPWPPSLKPTEGNPTASDMRAYCGAYARHFELLPHIKFNCKLLRLLSEGAGHGRGKQKSGGGWRAVFREQGTRKHLQIRAMFVVLCTGLYSSPQMPKYLGLDGFLGERLHARNAIDPIKCVGKDVLIIGNGRSYYDLAAVSAASKTARSLSLLYYKAHWPTPTKLGLADFHSRLAMTALQPQTPYYALSPSERTARKAVRAALALPFAMAKRVLAQRTKALEMTEPVDDLATDLLQGCYPLEGACWEAAAKHPDVKVLNGRVRCFTSEGALLDSGEEIAADLVIFCTGFSSVPSVLEPHMLSRLGARDDGLYLYRGILHPDVPDLGFVGLASTSDAMTTAALQAKWLVDLLQGRQRLPPRTDMAKDIEAQQAWRRRVMLASHNRGVCYAQYTQHYHDQLCKDLNQSPKRKGWRIFSECFGAYGPADYAPLMPSPINWERVRAAATSAAEPSSGVQRSGNSGVRRGLGRFTLGSVSEVDAGVMRRLRVLPIDSMQTVDLDTMNSFTHSGLLPALSACPSEGELGARANSKLFTTLPSGLTISPSPRPSCQFLPPPGMRPGTGLSEIDEGASLTPAAAAWVAPDTHTARMQAQRSLGTGAGKGSAPPSPALSANTSMNGGMGRDGGVGLAHSSSMDLPGLMSAALSALGVHSSSRKEHSRSGTKGSASMLSSRGLQELRMGSSSFTDRRTVSRNTSRFGPKGSREGTGYGGYTSDASPRTSAASQCPPMPVAVRGGKSVQTPGGGVIRVYRRAFTTALENQHIPEDEQGLSPPSSPILAWQFSQDGGRHDEDALLLDDPADRVASLRATKSAANLRHHPSNRGSIRSPSVRSGSASRAYSRHATGSSSMLPTTGDAAIEAALLAAAAAAGSPLVSQASQAILANAAGAAPIMRRLSTVEEAMGSQSNQPTPATAAPNVRRGNTRTQALQSGYDSNYFLASTSGLDPNNPEDQALASLLGDWPFAEGFSSVFRPVPLRSRVSKADTGSGSLSPPPTLSHAWSGGSATYRNTPPASSPATSWILRPAGIDSTGASLQCPASVSQHGSPRFQVLPRAQTYALSPSSSGLPSSQTLMHAGSSAHLASLQQMHLASASMSSQGSRQPVFWTAVKDHQKTEFLKRAASPPLTQRQRSRLSLRPSRPHQGPPSAIPAVLLSPTKSSAKANSISGALGGGGGPSSSPASLPPQLLAASVSLNIRSSGAVMDGQQRYAKRALSASKGADRPLGTTSVSLACLLAKHERRLDNLPNDLRPISFKPVPKNVKYVSGGDERILAAVRQYDNSLGLAAQRSYAQAYQAELERLQELEKVQEQAREEARLQLEQQQLRQHQKQSEGGREAARGVTGDQLPESSVKGGRQGGLVQAGRALADEATLIRTPSNTLTPQAAVNAAPESAGPVLLQPGPVVKGAPIVRVVLGVGRHSGIAGGVAGGEGAVGEEDVGMTLVVEPCGDAVTSNADAAACNPSGDGSAALSLNDTGSSMYPPVQPATPPLTSRQTGEDATVESHASSPAPAVAVVRQWGAELGGGGEQAREQGVEDVFGGMQGFGSEAPPMLQLPPACQAHSPHQATARVCDRSFEFDCVGKGLDLQPGPLHARHPQQGPLLPSGVNTSVPAAEPGLPRGDAHPAPALSPPAADLRRLSHPSPKPIPSHLHSSRSGSNLRPSHSLSALHTSHSGSVHLAPSTLHKRTHSGGTHQPGLPASLQPAHTPASPSGHPPELGRAKASYTQGTVSAPGAVMLCRAPSSGSDTEGGLAKPAWQSALDTISSASRSTEGLPSPVLKPLVDAPAPPVRGASLEDALDLLPAAGEDKGSRSSDARRGATGPPTDAGQEDVSGSLLLPARERLKLRKLSHACLLDAQGDASATGASTPSSAVCADPPKSSNGSASWSSSGVLSPHAHLYAMERTDSGAHVPSRLAPSNNSNSHPNSNQQLPGAEQRERTTPSRTSARSLMRGFMSMGTNNNDRGRDTAAAAAAAVAAGPHPDHRATSFLSPAAVSSREASAPMPHTAAHATEESNKMAMHEKLHDLLSLADRGGPESPSGGMSCTREVSSVTTTASSHHHRHTKKGVLVNLAAAILGKGDKDKGDERHRAAAADQVKSLRAEADAHAAMSQQQLRRLPARRMSDVGMQAVSALLAEAVLSPVGSSRRTTATMGVGSPPAEEGSERTSRMSTHLRDRVSACGSAVGSGLISSGSHNALTHVARPGAHPVYRRGINSQGGSCLVPAVGMDEEGLIEVMHSSRSESRLQNLARCGRNGVSPSASMGQTQQDSDGSTLLHHMPSAPVFFRASASVGARGPVDDCMPATDSGSIFSIGLSRTSTVRRSAEGRVLGSSILTGDSLAAHSPCYAERSYQQLMRNIATGLDTLMDENTQATHTSGSNFAPSELRALPKQPSERRSAGHKGSISGW